MKSPLGIAAMIALGMGLHNLGEGLAIGAAFATGAASLGSFLVVGFTLHNCLEVGVAICCFPSFRRRGLPVHYTIMDGKSAGWQCDRCGFPMVEWSCKVTCMNCGQRWDCSDLTIWVGDGRPRHENRGLEPDQEGWDSRDRPAG